MTVSTVVCLKAIRTRAQVVDREQRSLFESVLLHPRQFGSDRGYLLVAVEAQVVEDVVEAFD